MFGDCFTFLVMDRLLYCDYEIVHTPLRLDHCQILDTSSLSVFLPIRFPFTTHDTVGYDSAIPNLRFHLYDS
jgi:hypothetical protein